MPPSQNQRLRRMAQKASRRKAVVADKRRAEPATTSGRQALHIIAGARAPVRTCVMAERLFADGIGWVVLARTLPSGQVGASFFLVNVWCLGVKDAFFALVPQLRFEQRMNEVSRKQPLVNIDPSVARKLLHDAAAYAGSFGLAPGTGFAEAEALFGDIRAATKTFTFGKDGKPFFMSGPNNSPARIRSIMDTLTKCAGPDGFDYIVNVAGLD